MGTAALGHSNANQIPPPRRWWSAEVPLAQFVPDDDAGRAFVRQHHAAKRRALYSTLKGTRGVRLTAFDVDVLCEMLVEQHRTSLGEARPSGRFRRC